MTRMLTSGLLLAALLAAPAAALAHGPFSHRPAGPSVLGVPYRGPSVLGVPYGNRPSVLGIPRRNGEPSVLSVPPRPLPGPNVVSPGHPFTQHRQPVWVEPQWMWNGWEWVWVQGYWAQ